jgi:hypothetical protein
MPKICLRLYPDTRTLINIYSGVINPLRADSSLGTYSFITMPWRKQLLSNAADMGLSSSLTELLSPPKIISLDGIPTWQEELFAMPTPLGLHLSFHPDVFSGPVVLAWSKNPLFHRKRITCVSKNGWHHLIKKVSEK